MNQNATRYRRPDQDPPLTSQILEGLTQREVAVVFDLILLLKNRKKKETRRTADGRTQKRDAEDIEIRLWLLVELIKSFMDLYDQDDPQLVDHIESWFKGLDYVPNESSATLSFPAQTWDMFEGLSSEQWYVLTKLLTFLKEQDMLAKAKNMEETD